MDTGCDMVNNHLYLLIFFSLLSFRCIKIHLYFFVKHHYCSDPYMCHYDRTLILMPSRAPIANTGK